MRRSHAALLVVSALLLAAPGARAQISRTSQQVINAYRAVGKRGLSSTERKQLYREARKIPGKVTMREIKAIINAGQTALVEINKQLYRERGRKVPRHKTLKQKIQKAQQARSEAKTSWLKPEAEVQIGALGETTGMLVHERHLNARRPNSSGTILQWVPGHGGDVWAVKHRSGKVGVYSINEMTPVRPPSIKDYGVWLGD